MGPKKQNNNQQPFIQLQFQDYDPSFIRSTISIGNKNKIVKKKPTVKKTNDIKIVNIQGNTKNNDIKPQIQEELKIKLKQKSKSKSESLSPVEKKKNIACVRCRKRHLNCQKSLEHFANDTIDGKLAKCINCERANTECEYVQPSKKLNISLQYLQTLQNEISQLKKDNTKLRNNLKKKRNKINNSNIPFDINDDDDEDDNDNDFNDYFTNNKELQERPFINYSIQQMDPKQPLINVKATSLKEKKNTETTSDNEETNFSKNVGGGLVGSKTGQKYFVGSSSMTLFCMEIHSLIEKTKMLIDEKLKASSNKSSPDNPQNLIIQKEQVDTVVIPNNFSSDETKFSWSNNNVDKILEEEGNAYKIILSSNESDEKDTNSFNFSLPSYSYAMLLIDTFITYNDGCFYFFNEGLEKANLQKIYNGKVVHEDQILQTIWFCKIMLIFAIGEMYLGATNNKNTNAPSDQNLPGTEFFTKSSAIFGYLYSGNKIDNLTKPGSVETLLLYAFYLQVADCTVSSYLYFSMTLKTCLILGWHCDAELGKVTNFELEHHRRLFWTIYIYERMLSSKAGHPLSFQDASISCQLPSDFDMSNPPAGCENYIFPEAEYLLACINTTVISTKILNKLYNRKLKKDISPTVTSLIRELIEFRHSLPDFLQVDFDKTPFSITRLKCNIYTEYFNGINLAVRRLVYHFSHMFLKNWLQSGKPRPEYIRLDDYSENTIFLLNGSLTSSINTIQSLWSMFEQGQLAIFGYMDREYIFTAASTLVLMNATFGLHEQVNIYLDKALTILTRMRDQGNNPANLRRKQLLRLMKDLNLKDQMNFLISKFDVELKINVAPSITLTNSNEDISRGGNKLVRSHTDSSVVKDGSTNTILLQQNFFKKNDSVIMEKSPSENITPIPLHFLFQSPSNPNSQSIFPQRQINQDYNSKDIETVVKENTNKLLTTGKDFEDLDKIFEVLDNNLDDGDLWKDVQEQSAWLL